jgi:hypothetical protein
MAIKTSHMVLPIIFLEDKHKILLHLSILYECQQFFQHRICFSIQPQLQLVNLHRNRRYFVIKLRLKLNAEKTIKQNKAAETGKNIAYNYTVTCIMCAV